MSSDDHDEPPAGVDLLAEHPDLSASDAVASDEVVERHGRRAAGVRLPLTLVVLVAVLALVAIAAAGYTTWQWQALAGQEQARQDVEVATLQFMTTLTNWDANDGMAETRDELRGAGSEAFARDVDELFGTTEDLRGLADLGARSEGEIRDIYVRSLDGDRAETFAVVLQQATTDAVEFPEMHLRYASLALVRVDGRWLVDDLELLVDTAPGAAAPGPVAPSAGQPADDEDPPAAEPDEDDQEEAS